MTRDEFYAKYGETPVTFSGYYKFTFSYRGVTPDGTSVTVGFGGSSDEIYRHEVAPGDQERIVDLMPYTGTATKDGATVDEFYDL